MEPTMTKKQAKSCTENKYPKFKRAFDIPLIIEYDCSGPSKTQQQFTADADIYNILSKVTRGVPITTNLNNPVYGDLTDLPQIGNKIDALNKKLQDQQKVLEEKLEMEELDKLEKRQKLLMEKYAKKAESEKTTNTTNNKNDNKEQND